LLQTLVSSGNGGLFDMYEELIGHRYWQLWK